MSKIENLLDLMKALRHPQTGCPWDREQTFASIAPYTVEEAYEVADAIARDAIDELRDELGDLLFQVVFHARMAEEQGVFDFDDVVQAIVDKMEHRHPHVFGSEDERRAGPKSGSWERIKAGERAERTSVGGPASALDGVALALPALRRAEKLGKRAAGIGFDWPDDMGVREKIDEEMQELNDAIGSSSAGRVDEEFGDLLFSVVNLARHLGVDPERSLSLANRKFEARFRRMEARLRSASKDPADMSLAELEAAWQAAKLDLKTST